MTVLLTLLCILSTPDSPPPGGLPPAEFGTFLEGSLGGGVTNSSYSAGTMTNMNLELSIHFKYFREYSLGLGASLIGGSGKEIQSDDPNTEENESISDSLDFLTFFLENRFYARTSPTTYLHGLIRVGLHDYDGEVYTSSNEYPEYSEGSYLSLGFGGGMRYFFHELVYFSLQVSYHFKVISFSGSDDDPLNPMGNLDFTLGIGVAL